MLAGSSGARLGKICWLDLRGAGLSVLERLCLEECILHKDEQERNWMIVGCHEPVQHRYMKKTQRTSSKNESAAIVMGFGGKPDNLLHLDSVRNDRVKTIRRFSGGGTVVLDYDSIWVTIIGRGKDLVKEQFPRPIMEWTSKAVYEPMFAHLGHLNITNNTTAIGRGQNTQQTLVLDTKSCAVENTGKTIQIPRKRDSNGTPTRDDESPIFQLRENDYVLGDRKIGGNAQSIGKYGWLHHTSFLWDYDEENMMDYLTLPSKRPDYRASRNHRDFLVKLKHVYSSLSKHDFFRALQETTFEQFEAESVSAKEVFSLIHQHGGFDVWIDQHSRNKVIEIL